MPPNQHNVDVMTGYTAASTFNTAGMPESYGSIANDRAAMTVDSMTPSPNGGPPSSGPRTEEAARDAGASVVEPTRPCARLGGDSGDRTRFSRCGTELQPRAAADHAGWVHADAGGSRVPKGNPVAGRLARVVPPVGIGPYGRIRWA
jgi:hypothetical protein